MNDKEIAQQLAAEYAEGFFERAGDAKLDLKKIAADGPENDVTETYEVEGGKATITGHPDLVRLFTERYMK